MMLILRPRHRARGLSLLELLVVLSLVSLVTTILFQGYGFMLGSYKRIQARQAHESERALINAWFRNSLEAALAFTDPVERFEGGTDFIAATSFGSLLGASGLPTKLTWELRRDETGTRLLYRDSSVREALLVYRWEIGAAPEFRYLSRSGDWQSAWPGSGTEQLPVAVRLELPETENPPVTAVMQTRGRQFVSPAEAMGW
ncbi:MAG: prepilin-type N-terminal cleavage/methylation domain-containing protein [Pseudomonadota bacterium]